MKTLNRNQVQVLSRALVNNGSIGVLSRYMEAYGHTDRVRLVKGMLSLLEGELAGQWGHHLDVQSLYRFMYTKYPETQKDLFHLRPGYFKLVADLVDFDFVDWASRQMVPHIDAPQRRRYMRLIDNSVPISYMESFIEAAGFQSEDIAMRAVTVDGLLLRFVEDKFKTVQVMQKALSQNGFALQFIEAPHDPEMVIPAIIKQPALMRYVDFEGNEEAADALCMLLADRKGVGSITDFPPGFMPSVRGKAYVRDKAVRVGKFPSLCALSLGFNDVELMAILSKQDDPSMRATIATLLGEEALVTYLKGKSVKDVEFTVDHGCLLIQKFPERFPSWLEDFFIYEDLLQAIVRYVAFRCREEGDLFRILHPLLSVRLDLIREVPVQLQSAELVDFVVKRDPAMFKYVSLSDEQMEQEFNEYLTTLE